MEKILRQNKWTTADEIQFVKGLGGWKDPSWSNRKFLPIKNVNLKRQASILLKYKASMRLRKVWKDSEGTAIDPREVALFLAMLNGS